MANGTEGVNPRAGGQGNEKVFTDHNGRTYRGHGPRPYFVRCGRERWFGSLDAARAYAATIDGYYSIFFDYAPGTGAFIESNTRRAS